MVQMADRGLVVFRAALGPLPLSRAGLSPGGLLSISCSVLAPASSVTSQTPGITASPRYPCSGLESRQVARGSHRGVKDPGEGKEERAAAQPRKKFREPPLTQLPRPAQQVHSGTHHWESR